MIHKRLFTFLQMPLIPIYLYISFQLIFNQSYLCDNMQSTPIQNHDITLSVHSIQQNIVIKAVSRHTTYELELPPMSTINQSKKRDFTIISQTNQTLTLKIGAIDLSLSSEERTIANEFQETITTLTNNFQSQLEINARLQAQTKKLRKDLDELTLKFSQMTQKMLQLTQKVLQHQNIKSQLKQVKQQISQLKKQQPNTSNTQKTQNQSPKTFESSGSQVQIEIQQSLSQDKNEKSDQLLFGILDFLRKKISSSQNTLTQPEEEQTESTPSQQLINAFQILSQVPKIQWKDFDHSKIINTLQERITIKNFFPNDKEIVSMQLLYRASQNYFSTRKFHQKCNNIANTLVFVKTQFDKVIGGFTPLKWQSPSGENVKNKKDPLGQSFVFSLTEKQKFPLKNRDNAIVSKASWGPVFGCDLVINDKANQMANCYAKINVCYESANGTKESADVKRRLGGGDKNHFKVNEWEVWCVEFKQEKRQEPGKVEIDKLLLGTLIK